MHIHTTSFNHQLDRRLGGPQSQSGCGGKHKKITVSSLENINNTRYDPKIYGQAASPLQEVVEYYLLNHVPLL
jgi:hypothetical protein